MLWARAPRDLCGARGAAQMLPLAVALALDATLGEPPAGVHPVVWMGRALAWLESHAPRGEWARFGYGAAVALGLPALWAGCGWGIERSAPWPARALLLKPTLAGRALLEAGSRVEMALREGDLDHARQKLAWLVSRPTETLDASLVSAAAIESLAENFVDSWVAPLLAYALFGLGGAYAYRAANTADAMWGYRTPTYEWLGKVPARLDDALNWLPARLGALLLLAAAPPARRREAWQVWRRDGHRTASPNAGQPMAVVAGILGVRLEKVGHYTLNPNASPPGAADLARAGALVRRAMLLSALLASVVSGWGSRLTWSARRGPRKGQWSRGARRRRAGRRTGRCYASHSV